MDPLLESLKYVNSFHTHSNKNEPNKFYQQKQIQLVPNMNITKIVDYPAEPLMYVNTTLYNQTLNLVSREHNINYFINPQITVYANIDAVYNIFDVFYPHLLKRNNVWNFRYLVAQDKKGDFVRYAQYRKTNAYGVGITEGNDWDYQYINTTLFNPYDGYDLTGNISNKENWKHLIEDANGDVQDKYNLVFCNIIIDKDYNRRELELLYVNDFIIQTFIGISCTIDKFVVHCYDTHSLIGAQIVFILALCFDSISIIKPLCANVGTSDRYIVCEGIKKNIQPYITLLQNATNDTTQHYYISSLFSNKLPDDFVQWLTDINNEILEYQLMSFDDYYFDNVSVFLNVPDHVDNKPLNIIIK